MKQGITCRQWYQLDHMQIICNSSTQTTMPAPHNLVFTGWMLFLTANQQCQSTEGETWREKYASKQAYPAESGDDVVSDSETLMERPGSNHRPLHLHTELLRHVAERQQVRGAVTDTAEVSLVEHVLTVQQREHLEQQRRKEPVEDAAELQLRAAEVRAQVVEQLGEHVRVLLVQDAVGRREHVMQLATRTVDQLQTQTYTQRQVRSSRSRVYS